MTAWVFCEYDAQTMVGGNWCGIRRRHLSQGETKNSRPIMADKLKVWRDAEVAAARLAERVSQGGHHIPEDVIRRRFAAGLHNLERADKPAVDAWAEYDNVGESPILRGWGENQ